MQSARGPRQCRWASPSSRCAICSRRLGAPSTSRELLLAVRELLPQQSDVRRAIIELLLHGVEASLDAAPPLLRRFAAARPRAYGTLRLSSYRKEPIAVAALRLRERSLELSAAVLQHRRPVFRILLCAQQRREEEGERTC